MNRILLGIFGILIATTWHAQGLPLQWTLDAYNHTLRIGDVANTDLYENGTTREFHLQFDQTGYWNTMETNYFANGENIEASLTVDGEYFPEIGARLKG